MERWSGVGTAKAGQPLVPQALQDTRQQSEVGLAGLYGLAAFLEPVTELLPPRELGPHDLCAHLAEGKFRFEAEPHELSRGDA